MIEFRNWIEFWEKRDKSSGDLNWINGYVSPMAELSPQALEDLLSFIEEKLHLTKNDNLLDVGCGAGLLTIPLSINAKNTIGIDASKSMATLTKRQLDVIVAMAHCLPFRDESFDKVLCHSIFQYFPSHSYADKALKEFIRVCKRRGTILVSDVPNIEKKEAYLKDKGIEEFNLKRLYYSKYFFLDSLPGAEIEDHYLTRCRNFQFRFNVIFKKD